MAISTFRWLRTIPLLALTTICACGASDAPQVSLKFRAIGWAGESTTLVFKQNGKWTRLKAPLFAYSEASQYQGPSNLDLYTAEPLPPPVITLDGTGGFSTNENTKNDVIHVAPDAIPAVSVSIDARIKRATLLVGESGGKYNVSVVDDNQDDFPPGQVRLYNVTPYRMAIRCNKTTTIALNPNECRIVQAGVDEELTVEPAYEINGKWRKLVSKRIAARSGYQATHFFLQSGSNYFRSMDGQIMTAIPSFTVYNQVEDKDDNPSSSASPPATGAGKS